MDLSKFLAKVMGPFFVVSGLWLVFRGGGLEGIAQDLAQSPALAVLSGRLALIMGLLLVVSHNRWRADWTALVTLVGWLFVLSGLVTLFLPETIPHMGRVMSGAALAIYGIFVIAVGGFLAYRGFQS